MFRKNKLVLKKYSNENKNETNKVMSISRK